MMDSRRSKIRCMKTDIEKQLDDGFKALENKMDAYKAQITQDILSVNQKVEGLDRKFQALIPSVPSSSRKRSIPSNIPPIVIQENSGSNVPPNHPPAAARVVHANPLDGTLLTLKHPRMEAEMKRALFDYFAYAASDEHKHSVGGSAMHRYVRLHKPLYPLLFAKNQSQLKSMYGYSKAKNVFEEKEGTDGILYGHMLSDPDAADPDAPNAGGPVDPNAPGANARNAGAVLPGGTSSNAPNAGALLPGGTSSDAVQTGLAQQANAPGPNAAGALLGGTSSNAAVQPGPVQQVVSHPVDDDVSPLHWSLGI